MLNRVTYIMHVITTFQIYRRKLCIVMYFRGTKKMAKNIILHVNGLNMVIYPNVLYIRLKISPVCEKY